jgi:hypothetical protein
MTSPANICMEQGITPVLVFPCVRNNVVNALVGVELLGGVTPPVKRTTAMFCVVPDTGTFNPVMVKFEGAVNQYPLAFPV